jgi:hypothetical protein
VGANEVRKRHADRKKSEKQDAGSGAATDGGTLPPAPNGQPLSCAEQRP